MSKPIDDIIYSMEEDIFAVEERYDENCDCGNCKDEDRKETIDISDLVIDSDGDIVKYWLVSY